MKVYILLRYTNEKCRVTRVFQSESKARKVRKQYEKLAIKRGYIDTFHLIRKTLRK